jgi:hypothetical protein
MIQIIGGRATVGVGCAVERSRRWHTTRFPESRGRVTRWAGPGVSAVLAEPFMSELGTFGARAAAATASPIATIVAISAADR